MLSSFVFASTCGIALRDPLILCALRWPANFLSADLWCVGFLSGFGYTEMILFGVIALMLFGSRLPEVVRNFGATYRQLRGKVDEFQREFRDWDRMDSTPARTNFAEPDDEDAEKVEPKSPKFIPPPARTENEDGENGDNT